MGFSWAALYAGSSQKTIPIITEHQNESITEYGVMMAVIERSDASFTMP